MDGVDVSIIDQMVLDQFIIILDRYFEFDQRINEKLMN